MRGDGIDR